MHPETPVDLSKNRWYYSDNSDCIFKVLVNNTILIGDKAEGYIIIQRLNMPPQKMSAEDLNKKIANKNILEIEDKSKFSRHKENSNISEKETN